MIIIISSYSESEMRAKITIRPQSWSMAGTGGNQRGMNEKANQSTKYISSKIIELIYQ